jgi:putative DNA primase/helicase
MTAVTIAKALGGCKAGAAWMTPCPAHDDREPSLSIADGDDGKVLVHCHAGCEQHRVIAALRALGVWPVKGWGGTTSLQPRPVGELNRDADRTKAALRMWGATSPASGTRVETYLRSRDIFIPPPVPLRFHAALNHPRGQRWPAMVALVTCGADGRPVTVHRTFLARDGSGKAPVEHAKMMLGPCRGGAVRLGPAGHRLLVAEGIETALSVMQATAQPAWAALSTSGLRTLELPNHVRDVVLLADGDAPGEAAAQDAGLRWKRQGRRVRIARPPRGLDFNDSLRGRAFGDVEDAV